MRRRAARSQSNVRRGKTVGRPYLRRALAYKRRSEVSWTVDYWSVFAPVLMPAFLRDASQAPPDDMGRASLRLSPRGTQPDHRARWRRQRLPSGDGPDCARAFALSVIPGNRRRSSIAADSSPSWLKIARIASASASVMRNIPDSMVTRRSSDKRGVVSYLAKICYRRITAGG